MIRMTVNRMRKGIMFSIILFFLATTLTGLIMIQRSLISYHRERMYIEMRIKSLNNMYDSLIRDAGSTIDTSLRRAMNAAFNNISTEGVGLTEANETLKELVWDGTFDGRIEPLMENATFPYWVDKMEQVGTLMGFYINITPHTLEVKPYDSFNLLAEVKMDVNITDMQKVAALNRSVIVKKLVSIEELEDPLYPLYTGGFMTNTILMSPFIGNYTQLAFIGSDGGNGYVYGNTTTDITDHLGKILIVDNYISAYDDAEGIISENPINPILTPISKPYVVEAGASGIISEGIFVLLDGDNSKVWYIDNLKEHVENSYYQPSEIGASYLDRLEKRTNIHIKYSSQAGNLIGLESFIDKREIPPETPVDASKTNIDYLYFSAGTLDGNKVKGITTSSNWFRIDNEPAIGSIRHEEIYNVTYLIE